MLRTLCRRIVTSKYNEKEQTHSGNNDNNESNVIQNNKRKSVNINYNTREIHGPMEDGFVGICQFFV